MSCVLHGLFIRFPFSVYENVHLTEDAVNICNNIFLNQAKKRKKGEVGNKLTYKVVLYKTSIVLYILISSSTSFICNTVCGIGGWGEGFCDCWSELL